MKRYLIAGTLLLIPATLSAWQSPSFEVADVKPSDPSVTKMGKGRSLPAGRIEVPGYTLKELILFAYGVTEDMISGGPKWVGEDRFDIVAKAPANSADDALRIMLQNLLTDRFRLALHREQKPMPAYVLTLAKTAVTLRPGTTTQSQCMWASLEGGLRRRECHNLTMDEFARQLPHTGGIGIDLPVVDETGMKGSYDFEFEVGSIPNGGGVVESSGPTIFAALSKLGLRLESRKIPMPVIVIDGAEQPAAN